MSVGKRRLLWLAALAVAAILYLFENSAATLCVLLALLLLPLPGALVLRLCRRRLHADIVLPPGIEQESTLTGKVTLESRLYLPLFVGLRLEIRNLRTDETAVEELQCCCFRRSQAAFSLELTHCGLVQVRACKVYLQDVFGLFRAAVEAPCQAQVLVQPRLFESQVLLEHQGAYAPDSDVYSQTQPGSDPGETFEIREFVPGDALRQIHWKLSEKTDRLMSRQFAKPIINDVLLLLDTSRPDTADLADALTVAFASVSHALTRQGIAHQVVWRDADADAICRFSVSDVGEFDAMVEALLSLAPRTGGSVAARWLQEQGHCAFSHVLLFAPAIPRQAQDLYNGNRVTVLLCSPDGCAEGLQPDGLFVTRFAPRTAPRQLSRLEV